MKNFVIYFLVCVVSFSYTYKELRENMFSGGVPRDAIPSIDSPIYKTTSEASDFMNNDDIVFISEEKIVTIIPQKILVWHEIVNETSENKVTSITYCPLTATVIGYRLDTTLGVSGKLINSNLVMYDRKKELLWPQIMGTSIDSDAEGKTLDAFPLIWSTWEAAVKNYPNSRVLSRKTGRIRNYGKDPYGDYGNLSSYYHKGQPFFPLMSSSKLLPPKTMIRGLFSKGTKVAVPWEDVREEKIINVNIGDIRAVLIYDENLKSIRAFSSTFDGKDLEFFIENGKIMDKEQKRIWNFKGKSGQHSLIPHDGMDAFWFAWHAFYPETKIVGD